MFHQIIVTPAKAGVQEHSKNWIPAFAGMTKEVLGVTRY
jgi:hypothetical protein